VPEPLPQPTFLDVPHLLEASVPRPRPSWAGYGIGAMLLVVLMAAMLVGSEGGRLLARLLSAVALIGIATAAGALVVATVRRHRAEQGMVEAAGELVQLRRWPQAALVLEQILSHPSPSHVLRGQALVYLASVLARYHRFDDAIAVHTHLLEHAPLDRATAFSVRVARALAMLREDHLVDADRAISEMRRLDRDDESAGLALVEIYRDVKTGHPDEAAAIFEDKLPVLRDQLGHRVADAYALAARAYDLLGRSAEAQDAYTRATLLAPLIELHRRYPDVEKLAGRYQPSPAPPEAA
jgi:tetratricopeptide (TPR) repeat protein